MGDPAQPTDRDRAATRELAAAIVEAVRNDEAMPHGLSEIADTLDIEEVVESLLFRLALEITLSTATNVSLQAECDRLRESVGLTNAALSDAGVPPCDCDDREMFPDERVRWLRERVGAHMQDVADLQSECAEWKHLCAAAIPPEEYRRLETDRDEWRQQHDNAVACWREEVARFAEQLSAMTAARDEACEIAHRAIEDNAAAMPTTQSMRIAELRKVGG